MYRRPNSDYNWKSDKEKKKYNQIGKRFSEFFDIILNPDYYEGSKYGKYFSGLKEDGTSTIYIKDPLESELHYFAKSKSNVMKYLVGYTGIGKTTLLRNFWKIFDRDIKIENNCVILYISFYYAHLSADNPQQSIENEIVGYLKRAIRKIMKENKELFLSVDIFWEKFYDYIEENKPTILESEDLTPNSNLLSFILSNQEENISKMEQLQKACEIRKLEYYSCLFKYILNYIDNIHDIILIYDDIESKEGIFHRPLVEIARHLHSCFSTIDDKTSLVKSIIALRAYTYRSNIDRQLEARRGNLKKHTIKKEKAVNLHDIFQCRFEEIERIEKIEKKVRVLKSYKEAKEQLFIVEQQINTSFGNLIYNLVNHNLCNAMILYGSILTNIDWIAKNEEENNGSFHLIADNYKLTADRVFKSIACGNELSYSYKSNEFIPNILHNHKENTDLLGIYVIKYMIENNAINLYSETYVEGDKILNDIVSLFTERSDSQARIENWKSRLLYIISYLYSSGVLLRSIYDIENISEKQIKREYNGAYKLYLSPRGQSLYYLLSQNALLLELYRDDIYTDLNNNDILTNDLSTNDLMIYLINYVEYLFKCEQKYIGNSISCIERYQALFGKEFIVLPLLEGIVKNIRSYYPDREKGYYELMRKVLILINKMNDYIKILDNEEGIEFSFSKYISDSLIEIQKDLQRETI